MRYVEGCWYVKVRHIQSDPDAMWTKGIDFHEFWVFGETFEEAYKGAQFILAAMNECHDDPMWDIQDLKESYL